MNAFKSGIVWTYPPKQRGQVVRRVCETLQKTYGEPRFGNPRNSVDDLIFIILSNKSSPSVARRVYDELKQEYNSWNELADGKLIEVKRVLNPVGLATVKARQMRATLKKIRKDFGKCSLTRLKRWDSKKAEDYLKSLDGVSEKVAKCVMIYTLNFDVLPVDTHIHRIATRLGWTARPHADQCHRKLETVVKPKYRMGFHVACIAHGRSTCRPANPSCQDCVIRRYCVYGNGTRHEPNASPN